LFEVLVVAADELVADPELARPLMTFCSHCGALTASEPRGALVEPEPAPLAAMHERALRCVDALQPPVGDGDAAPHQKLAADFALAEDLVVLFALFVAVVEPADGRVTPIHDPHTAGRVEVGATPDEHLAAAVALLEHHAPEVGGRRIDITLDGVALAAGEVLEPLHLLQQGGDVFEPRGRDLVAQ